MNKTFKTYLYRDGEEIPVSVEYVVHPDELFVDCVIAESTGKEIITTVQEDAELRDEANKDFGKFQIYSR